MIGFYITFAFAAAFVCLFIAARDPRPFTDITRPGRTP